MPARTYLEDPLRTVTHLIMSTPEYQIGQESAPWNGADS